MSVQELLEMANGLSPEDRTLLCSRLNEQVATDFTPAEVEEIRHAIAEADAEFERGECLTSEQLAREIGL